MIIRLIGVAFDGMGRDPGQAGASAALRAAGLEAAFASREAVLRPDIAVPPPRAARDPETGLLNGAALLTMLDALGHELRDAFAAGQFPLVYGADCSVLLAALPAMRDALGEPGLLFIDGHEDATTLERSPDGECANMEIAMLLGLTGERLPPPVSRAVGILESDALEMVGPHDAAFRDPLGVATIAGRARLTSVEEILADPAHVARNAVRRICSRTPNWWMHTDLDVLDETEFSARGAPGEPAISQGLTWQQLSELVRTALAAGGCRGWSVVIYNPDLDPDRSQARRIVGFVGEIAPLIP
jgi:arginase